MPQRNEIDIVNKNEHFLTPQLKNTFNLFNMSKIISQNLVLCSYKKYKNKKSKLKKKKKSVKKIRSRVLKSKMDKPVKPFKGTRTPPK